MKQQIKKVVLAYSGGLDTSIIIPWLKENYDNCEVIAVAADVGQGAELSGLEEKAIKTGASKLYIEDLRKEFVEDFVFPTMQADAVYENQYLLGTSFARPIIAKRIVEIAKKYIGIPYVWGGNTPKQGFDCSGLVVYVYKEWSGYQFQLRTRLYLDGTSIKYSNLVAGDLVFFDTAGYGNITHVGIYVGDGQFIHAPKPGTRVRIESMAPGSYYARTFVCARRIAG